jgi:rhodanese-related sulfurtransferase
MSRDNTLQRPSPLEIDVFTLREKMNSHVEDWVLLDCREAEERAIALIEPSLFIPMQDIPQRIAELEHIREANLVVYCHGGVRSFRVMQFLRHHGFLKAQSLVGGIDAWSASIDPSVPRY